ncbi:MAG: bifunctional hydroxymethylpyrimidine kinase/phosphomethylpyrimidine kinase [Lentisphaeria bacterium]|jgi:hydroxymethylpyrimidine/phosphomethylpyrimidine kinase|nr:bifunctional hydroxymethylpyrimidine kinase/phosphomethylpyrimidine kinase [Lentisphaeria bacterium]
MKTVLSIAASDPSGGAGIQADLRAISAHGLYGMAVPTALTVQNTLGVSGVLVLEPEFLAQQLRAVLSDIRPDAVKIGAMPGADHARVTADLLREFHAANVVCDPVLASTSGAALGTVEAVELLAPCVSLLTPNLPEAARLLGRSPADFTSDPGCIESAAKELAARFHAAVLLKGGHRTDGSFDDFFLMPGNEGVWLPTRVAPPSGNHGTGCLLSSSIACGLASGLPMPESVRRAKERLSDALARGLSLGHGNSPVDFR